jgi:hypothetical protein
VQDGSSCSKRVPQCLARVTVLAQHHLCACDHQQSGRIFGIALDALETELQRLCGSVALHVQRGQSREELAMRDVHRDGVPGRRYRQTCVLMPFPDGRIRPRRRVIVPRRCNTGCSRFLSIPCSDRIRPSSGEQHFPARPGTEAPVQWGGAACDILRPSGR